MANFKQGEDLIIEIPVLDNQNNKVSLTTATKIRVGFFINNREAKKYLDVSLEPIISGYGEVTINTVNDYVLDVEVLRADSSQFSIGDLNATILVSFPDAVLTDGIVNEYTYDIGSVTKGYLKTEDLTL